MSQVPLRVSTLISPRELADKINLSANIRILDCTWYMPFSPLSSKKNALQEFYRDHLPGAQFFDIDKCTDQSTEYACMLPTPAEFEEYVGKLGIDNNTHVVVYDNNPMFGCFSAQRVWWTFRMFGHNLVSLLDGGLPRWLNDGYGTTDEVESLTKTLFNANYNSNLIKTYDEMEKNIEEQSFQVVDTRIQGRYDGSQPEPRPGVKSGHMVGTINIPFRQYLCPKEKRFKEKGELLDLFDDYKLDLNKPLTAMCGSGISACFFALAAAICDKTDVSVYDGGWTEWFYRAKPEFQLDVPKW